MLLFVLILSLYCIEKGAYGKVEPFKKLQETSRYLLY